ncbi:hypothetical protein OUY22_29470 [Nonomuraea sp. MCN248]|uniref:EF-hand domain-containing protein n=1 Tax=Nonomuraea corallina TaxID=2989783 RepID=A0ABT4SKW5_9ACTN|nr:hypothetical protein [Nonomuraea corallina]MDA0637556.1 hypothetical protein [Nonomuraea corallina]
MSGFSGVKQAEFDTMTSKHAEAAGRLEELARTLHRELRGAGLDTAPAARLRELARRITTQAEDLRRRQQLVHELQRQKAAFGRSTSAGSFIEMPDRLEDAKDLLDGTVAGRAALRAAEGDEQALAELEKYVSRAGDPEFVNAFLAAIGARGVTRMVGSVTTMLRDAMNRDDSERKTRLAVSSRNVLSMLSISLAKGTDPDNPAYLGDDFLDDLVREGRAQHATDDGGTYLGYQAQALIWRAHDGTPPYSKKFMEVVGRDVIVYEREQRQDTWAASQDPLGRAFGTAQIPIVDLAGSLGLGTLMRPGAPTRGLVTKSSSMVEDLFHAAKSSREASHALLDHTPAGWNESVLDYLLTTRWGASRYLDDYEPISGMLITATTGQDSISKKLAAQLIKTTSDEIREAFQRGGDNLEMRDREIFDRYAPLSYPLARAISAHIDQLSRLYLNRAAFGQVAPQDMSYALVLATSSDQGFEAMIRAQTEQMRAALADAPPVGLNASNAERFGLTIEQVKEFDLNSNGRIDKTDTLQYLMDRIVEEATPFKHLIETRRQVLIAQGFNDQKADDSLKTMVGDAIGVLPIPGAKSMGALANGAFGEIIGAGYEKLAEAAYSEVSEQVAQRMSPRTRTLDEAYRTLADNRLAVERLAEQMISATMLNKGMLEDASISDRTFVTGTPPRIKDFSQMSPEEYSDFLAWARTKGGGSDLLGRFSADLGDSSSTRTYLELRPSTSEGEK